jgi:hypothetical protein
VPNTATTLEDALNPRMAGSTEGMTLQVLAQIRDSLSAQNRDVRNVVESISDVRERVIRLEENSRRLDEMEADLRKTDAKVGVLMADKDRRDGARSAFGMIKDWSPFIAAVMATLAAAWLYGRSLNIVPAPPLAAARVEATIQHDERRIEGAVGGKP